MTVHGGLVIPSCLFVLCVRPPPPPPHTHTHTHNAYSLLGELYQLFCVISQLMSISCKKHTWLCSRWTRVKRLTSPSTMLTPCIRTKLSAQEVLTTSGRVWWVECCCWDNILKFKYIWFCLMKHLITIIIDDSQFSFSHHALHKHTCISSVLPMFCCYVRCMFRLKSHAVNAQNACLRCLCNVKRSLVLKLSLGYQSVDRWLIHFPTIMFFVCLFNNEFRPAR